MKTLTAVRSPASKPVPINVIFYLFLIVSNDAETDVTVASGVVNL